MTRNRRSEHKDKRMWLLVALLLWMVQTLNAQTQRVTLNLHNEEVATFIRQVEKQTPFTFVYRNSVLNPKTRVSMVCNGQPLQKVLTQVLTPLGVQFSFNNNTVVLVRKNDERRYWRTHCGR